MATILLVDDSKMLLKHIQRMLISGGYTVLTASSGHDAVELLASTPVDLVLTDLHMPSPDGFEIIDTVRAKQQPPPLVVMSSDSKACHIFRGTQTLGAAATLLKPFATEDLLSTVRRVLAERTAGPVDSSDRVAVA